MSRDIWAALACLAALVIIAFASATDIGFSRSESFVESVRSQDVLSVQEDGTPYAPGPAMKVHSVTLTNGFIPRQKVLPFPTACLYDSASRRGTNVGVRWQAEAASELDSRTVAVNYVELGYGSKTVNLLIDRYVLYKPRPVEVPMPPDLKPVQEEKYDSLLLFLKVEEGGWQDSYNTYTDCYNLQETDLARARSIPVVKG